MCCLAQKYYKILPSVVMNVKISETSYTHTLFFSTFFKQLLAIILTSLSAILLSRALKPKSVKKLLPVRMDDQSF